MNNLFQGEAGVQPNKRPAVAFWCVGKASYATKGEAIARIKRQERRGGVKRSDLRAYRCHTCHAWHVGGVR